MYNGRSLRSISTRGGAASRRAAAWGRSHSVDRVEDLAVCSAIGALLNLGVVEVEEVVEPGEELSLANEEGGVHHAYRGHLGRRWLLKKWSSF